MPDYLADLELTDAQQAEMVRATIANVNRQIFEATINIEANAGKNVAALVQTRDDLVRAKANLAKKYGPLLARVAAQTAAVEPPNGHAPALAAVGREASHGDV